MAAVIAAAAGAAAALFALALEGGLASLFWPQAALGVAAVGAVAAGLGGLLAAAGPGRWAAWLARHDAAVLALAGLGAAATFPAMGMIAGEVAPGGGLFALPPPFLALAAGPFAALAAVAVSWGGGGRRGRVGRLAAGAGAGWLLAAAIAGLGLPLRAPWFGGRAVQLARGGDGELRLVVDRGLRAYAIAPPAAPLAFAPAGGGRGDAEVLAVGWPEGRTLAALLGQPGARLTVLEEEPALVDAALRHWPALAAARAAGRVRFVVGSPRRSLERLPGRFGLIVLHDGASPEAYVSRALNLSGDGRWTVEAFRAYLARLAPGGLLLVERTATGRVVATLRQATGLPAREFLHKVAILGRRGGLSSQCWYRPDGLSGREERHAATAAAARAGGRPIYIPTKHATGTFYDRLIGDDALEGLFFSTPLDLSPALDERPFFDDVDRVRLSPTGRSLPEEPPGPPGGAPLAVVPPGDRGLAAALLLGVAGSLAIAGTASRRAPERAACLRLVAGPALALGACAALSAEALAAWARWLAPSPAAAQAAVGAALLAAGAAGLRCRGALARGGALALGAALSLAAALAYRVPSPSSALGGLAAAAAIAAVAAVPGALLGCALRGAVAALGERSDGAAARFAGVALAGAALAWPAARLAATHFGYRLVWALGAVAALAAARSLRRAAAGGPGAPAT